MFRSSFLPTDVTILPALPGLYSYLYVYILNYLDDFFIVKKPKII